VSIIVRDATAADEATLLGFLRDLQDAERVLCASRRPGHEVDRFCYDGLLNSGAHILLAEDEDRAIGFVAGRLKVDSDELQVEAWQAHGHISDLFVIPVYRGRGVAQLLLRAMADRLRGEGAGRLRIGALSANKTAVKAYEQFGFQPFEVRLDIELG
jgi:ribosomal protein S18 acetylase RimI-like enzyme